jgi:hypothetical protein
MRTIALISAAAVAIGLSLPLSAEPAVDWSKVGTALGKPGMAMPGGVYRVGLPRSDLHVSIDGIALKPSLALGGCPAFKSMGNQAMVMGDLVLTDSEVNPVMTRLEKDGFEITALHNHLLRAMPNTMYMHLSGRGDAVKLATALHRALAASGTPFQAASVGASAPIDLDTGAVARILGFTGKTVGGVYQVTVPRRDSISDGGMPVPGAMGAAIAINFQPLGQGKAAITGDFVLLASEVNPVLRALREHGIEVTALHNHMLDDQPRAFFMHFWAHDDSLALAKGLRAALDRVSLGRS